MRLALNISMYSPVVLGLLIESKFGPLLAGGKGGPFTSLLVDIPIFLAESIELKLLLEWNEFDELGDIPPRFGGGGGGN